MSILIEGMEMPTKENAVILITPSGDVWMIGDMPNEDTHLVKAKAFHVPEPHGRLGDLDKLNVEVRLLIKENMFSRDDARDLLETIADAPTVIQASEV